MLANRDLDGHRPFRHALVHLPSAGVALNSPTMLVKDFVKFAVKIIIQNEAGHLP